MTPGRPPTLGVFDSGFGGLTVLRALLPLLPGARFVYLGDTARLPYGAKSRDTVVRYALSSAEFLLAQGIDLLVVACNTASALALDQLQAALPVPVVGVIRPGAAAAATEIPEPERADATVLVLATAATVHSHAYRDRCAALGLSVYEKSCPLLVPLVEEGWIDHAVTRAVLRIYLEEALAAAPQARVLLLGCTHYPLLTPVMESVLAELGRPLHIIDSAAAVAEAVHASVPAYTPGGPGTCTFYATDSTAKFRDLGSRFLGQPLPEVQLLDLGG